MEENIQPKGWFNRNWKWAVPTGGCLLVIILFAAFAGTIFYGVTSMLSDSQAYQDAFEKARTNELVIERLGEPLEPNGIMGGNINYRNGYGEANISIPVKGPKGEGTIRVEGGGVDDTWSYDKMEVYLPETDEIIDLLHDQEFLD